MNGSKREWMIGRQGHTGMLTIDELAGLIRAGQLREQEMVKRQGQPWKPAREVPELAAYFGGAVPGGVPEERTIMFPPPVAAAPPAPAPEPEPEPAPGPDRSATPPVGRVEEPTPLPMPAVSAAPPAKKKVEEPTYKWPSDPPPSRDAAAGGDFLGDVAIAFNFKQLGAVLGLLFPAFFLASLITYPVVRIETEWIRDFMIRVPQAIFGAGFLAAFTVAVCMARRRLDGSATPLSADVVRVAPSVFGIAIAAVLAYMVFWTGLWILGWIRNWGVGSAAMLRFLQIIPILVAGLAVATKIAGMVGAMYAGAAAAVESTSGSAMKRVQAIAKTAGGRLVVHAFGIVAVVGLTGAVCQYLVQDELWPLLDTKPPDTVDVQRHWHEYWWPVKSLYKDGLLLAAAFALPVSLAATLSMLSYRVLRPFGAAAETRA